MAKAPEAYKRGGTYWVRYTDAQGIARRESLGVRVGAPGETEAVNAALARKLTGEAPRARSGPTLGDVYERAIREHWAKHKDRRGVESKWALLLAVKGEEGKPILSAVTPIASLNASLLSTLKGALLARGDSPKTVNRKLAVLSSLLHLSVEWELLDRVPVIKRFAEKRGRIRWLTPVEEGNAVAFLRAHGKPHACEFADLVEVLLDTGLRLGEALRLTDSCVMPEVSGRPRLMVWEQKGGGAVTSRAVPLTKRAALILAMRGNREPTAPRGQSRPFAGLTQDICGHLWADARAALGLAHDDEFVIHALRHTFGVRMIEAGVDIRTLQVLMGHAKSSTTEIYAHVTGKGAANAIDALERVRAAVPESAPILTLVDGRRHVSA